MALTARADAPARQRRDVQFNIRVEVETKEQIERAAKVARQTLTEFTKAAVIERAEEVLARHDQIVLSDRDYELFTKIMTEEHEPTELALRGAAEFMSGTMEGSRYRW